MPPQQGQAVAVDDLIRQTAIAAGVPPELALAVAEQESRFNPTAVNPQPVAGGQHATGTFQLLPSTARDLGVDVTNPVQNIQGGVKYLRQLMDRHQGDLQKVLAEYGGVKNDTTYVPQVLARMPKFAPAGPAAPGGPPPPPPGSFAAEHPYLNAMVQGLDPHEQGGRRNIAGGIGGLVGGIGGGLLGGAGGAAAGIETGPGAIATGGAGAVWGARTGSVAGAALFGAAEDLLVEQTGLGKWLGEHLPWGKVDEPVEETDPKATMGARLWNAAKAGGEQGIYEVGGQLIAAPVRIGARAALETPIGRAAADAISAGKQKAVTGLRGVVDTLRGERAAVGVAGAQAGRALDTEVGAGIDAAREAARTSVEQVRAQEAERLAAAAADKRAGVRGAAQAGITEREAAQADAAAAEAAARAEAEAQARLDAAQIEAAREAARTSLEGVRSTVGEELAQATAGKRQGVREAVRSGQAAREATRAEAEAEIDAARQTYQENLRKGVESGVPSESAAGRAVGEVFEGPARTALDEAGQAVTKAAQSGPKRALTAAQTEARRIVETELAPHLTEFPRTPTLTKTGKVKKPPIGKKLRNFLKKIDDVQLQQLIEHPAMKVLSRILNAPETVDFAALHQLESSLRRSVQGSGDKVVNSYVTDTTRHLVGILRDTLAGRLEEGATPHAPFEQATKHYADIVKLFTEGHAPLVKDVALHAPEKIVQALRPDDPTPAKMLVRLLTETAEAGGKQEGKKAGQQALQRVQDAWLHRNILTGPIDGLAERVAALRLHPEFVDALFHSTSAGRQMLENAERLGIAFKQAGERTAERVAEARAAARTAVGHATETGEAAIAQARQKAAEAIKTTRSAGRASVREARGASATKAAEHEAAIERARAAGKARVGEVRATGREAVRKATETGERGIAEARQKAAQAIRGARTGGRAQVGTERAVGTARQEAQKQSVEAARLRAGDAIRRAVGDVRSRAASLGSSAAEVEERAFAKSPLNPRNDGGRSPHMKRLEWVVRAALAGQGIAAFGPAGILVGTLLRGGKKVPEHDLLRYVVHSGPLTRAVIKGLFHPVPRQILNTVGATGVREAGAVLKTSTPQGPPR